MQQISQKWWSRSWGIALAFFLLWGQLLPVAGVMAAGGSEAIYHVKTTGADTNTGESWGQAFQTLQKALEVADTVRTQKKVEILIAAGTYYPTADQSGDKNGISSEKTFVLLPNVDMYGGFPAEPADGMTKDDRVKNNSGGEPLGADVYPYKTILSGDLDQDGAASNDDAYHVVYANNANLVSVLDGVTITAGNARWDCCVWDKIPNGSGGGMYVQLAQALTLKNVTFDKNKASDNGAGIYTLSGLTLSNVVIKNNMAVPNGSAGGMLNNNNANSTLTDVIFKNNQANTGGGLFNASSSPTLTNVMFVDNQAINGGGGGMYNSHSSPTLTNVKFYNNTTGDNGGGMNNSTSSPTLTNVLFSGNTATYSGGGMSNTSNSSPTLTDVVFSHNTSDSVGGGIANNASSAKLTNVTITGNEAINGGGGGVYNYQSSSTLTNVLITGNTAESKGGGMYIPRTDYDPSTPTLTNVTIVGNTSVTGSGLEIDGYDTKTRASIRNSIILDYVNKHDYTILENSITSGQLTDLFVNPSAGNYRLKLGSPAINTGSNAYYESGENPDLSGITKDLDGNPRVNENVIDVGAYEFHALSELKIIDPRLQQTLFQLADLAPGTTSYNLEMQNKSEMIQVIAKTENDDFSIKVDGHLINATTSDTIFLPLSAFPHTLTVEVTSSAGVVAAYSFSVAKKAPIDVTLSGLALHSGATPIALEESFQAGVVGPYHATVSNDISGITVTPTVPTPNPESVTVKVNNTAVGSGQASGTIPLTVGKNTIEIRVEADRDPDQFTTYTVEVTRQPITLSGLIIGGVTLYPAFTANETSYTANVGNSVTDVIVQPTVANATTTIAINGTIVTSGHHHNVSLNVGTNPITVVVTAQNGSTNTYTITVTRAGSSNHALSNLTLSEGTLSPNFAANETSYTASVANSVTTLDVTPTVADATATVTVSGTPVTSGSAQNVALNVGANPITVVVTAQNGSTNTYTITVTRAASSNQALSNLTLSEGTLSPAFAANVTSYTASVGNSVTTLDVTPTVADATATVTVNGTPVTSGSAQNVALNVGANPITVIVTAQDGTTNTYTITVTRAASSNHALSNLTLSQGTLSPAFAANETSYTASVANSVTTLDVTPTVADATATVTVNGTPVTSGSAQNVTLNVGANPITVIVTAQDGSTNTYTINVTRAAAYIPPTPTPIPKVPVTGVELEQTVLSLVAGTEAITLNVTVLPKHATNKALIWESSNPEVATVDKNGLVSPLAAGTTTITVTTLDGNKKASVKVTVVDEVAVAPYLEATKSSFHLQPKESATMKVYLVDGKEKTDITTAKETKYSIDNKLVSVKQGKITAGTKTGESVITVKYKDKELTVRVVVEKKPESIGALEVSEPKFWIKPNGSARLKVYTSNGNKRSDISKSKDISYSVDNDLLTVEQGRIKAGKKEGESVITVHYKGQEVEIPVLVTKLTVRTLTVSDKQAVLVRGDERALTLEASFSNKTSKEVTEEAIWTSSNADVAEVTEDGTVIAHSAGTAIIKAKYFNKEISSKVLVVTKKVPKALRSSKMSLSMSVNQEYSTDVKAVYDKNYLDDISSEDAEWSSDHTDVATIENGVITAVAKGKATITVEYKGKTLMFKVTVR